MCMCVPIHRQTLKSFGCFANYKLLSNGFRDGPVYTIHIFILDNNNVKQHTKILITFILHGYSIILGCDKYLDALIPHHLCECRSFSRYFIALPRVWECYKFSASVVIKQQLCNFVISCIVTLAFMIYGRQ